MASLFNFDGALTKREQIPNEMGLGCGRLRDMRCEQYHLRQYESASRFGKRMQASLTKPLEYGIATDLHTTKAISHEDKTMNAMNAAIFLALNCKTSQEKRLMLDSLLEMGQIKESVHRILSKKIK
ncbi:hypothetical protein ACI5AD_001741 [Cronobacter sakazakii]|uniref:hypothetical protein n=1 Tax=Cronobacter sakazakii TaxID=28141 RepID=UPI0013A64A61|nr:hypothetical protein [Cronobacter sakazakii]EJK9926551.1 hypothetical protein [Cronobacter sakazakii]ELY4054674.1 hypothetical protein [Cronobacter sakazakii]ELY4339512.1 hypothetical protein [Cronobacter sakazakii]ELY6389328.1 hypothetical protein [Cronobacter sakazakii]MBF4839497.1 hypothetical protein [Cronobacter sakazakii]